MKRIAIDGRMWGSGFTGIGNYLQETAPRVFQKMPETEFVAFVKPETADRLKAHPNVKTIIAREKIYSPGEQTTFLYKLRRAAPNLSWFPHFNVPLLFHAPFVATIHDLTILRYPGKKMAKPWHRAAYHQVLRHALERSERLIAVSEFTKNEITRFAPHISPEKIRTIGNGVNAERFHDISEEQVIEFKRRFGPEFFLVAGVWREHKNVVGAIHAFEMFRKYGGKGHLVITGRPDPFYSEVEHAAHNSRYAPDIHLTGFMPDELIPAIMKAASALIFPSFAEGFGMPALEAMAAGTPVAASNASSLPEVCGEAALLFDPKNPEDIALKMVDILQPEVRLTLIAKGNERIKQFSWEAAAAATVTVFEELLKKNHETA